MDVYARSSSRSVHDASEGRAQGALVRTPSTAIRSEREPGESTVLGTAAEWTGAAGLRGRPRDSLPQTASLTPLPLLTLKKLRSREGQ